MRGPFGSREGRRRGLVGLAARAADRPPAAATFARPGLPPTRPHGKTVRRTVADQRRLRIRMPVRDRRGGVIRAVGRALRATFGRPTVSERSAEALCACAPGRSPRVGYSDLMPARCAEVAVCQDPGATPQEYAVDPWTALGKPPVDSCQNQWHSLRHSYFCSDQL